MNGWGCSPFIRAGLKQDYLGEGIALRGPRVATALHRLEKIRCSWGACLLQACASTELIQSCAGIPTIFVFESRFDQNKEVPSFISVFTYDVLIHFSRRMKFCPLPLQYFEEVPRIPSGSRKPGSGIRINFCPFSWGSNHSINGKPAVCYIIAWTIRGNTEKCRSTSCFARIDV